MKKCLWDSLECLRMQTLRLTELDPLKLKECLRCLSIQIPKPWEAMKLHRKCLRQLTPSHSRFKVIRSRRSQSLHNRGTPLLVPKLRSRSQESSRKKRGKIQTSLRNSPLRRSLLSHLVLLHRLDNQKNLSQFQNNPQELHLKIKACQKRLVLS